MAQFVHQHEVGDGTVFRRAAVQPQRGLVPHPKPNPDPDPKPDPNPDPDWEASCNGGQQIFKQIKVGLDTRFKPNFTNKACN